MKEPRDMDSSKLEGDKLFFALVTIPIAVTSASNIGPS